MGTVLHAVVLPIFWNKPESGKKIVKVLVTGANGQLGSDVMKELLARGIPCFGTGRADFDLTDFDSAGKFLENNRPDAVIHCAAYTAVDRAEDDEELCRKVNAEGTWNLAQICRGLSAKMIYISTDYVFPGTGETPFEADDSKGPLNVYGRTKLAGEEAVRDLVERYFIVRTSWVFGKGGNNFIKTMLRLGKTHREVNVVCDQVGSPTYTVDLAPLLCDMIMTEKYGVYHATNEGYCSWAEFAAEIFRQAGDWTKVNPVPTSAYPTKAKRPLNSRLSKKGLVSAGFRRLPAWRDALSRYLKEVEL